MHTLVQKKSHVSGPSSLEGRRERTGRVASFFASQGQFAGEDVQSDVVNDRPVAPGSSSGQSHGYDFNRLSLFPTSVRAEGSSPQAAQNSGGSSGGLHIQSGPSVKLPPSPQPQKGEQPIGTLRDKVTGADQKIYPSFVTSGLWWFNGATPTLDTLYPTAANIPLASLGKGKFNVKVTAGADKISLDGGGATVTGDDLTSVKATPIGPSTKAKDVTIEVKHRAPGAKADTTNSVQLEVRAPGRIDLLGTDHSAKGSNGFLSLTSLQAFDNFGKPMPFIDVNEDFSTATLEKGVSSEWKDGFDARTKGSDITRDNAVFRDQYAIALSGPAPASMTPQPSNPASPLGKTRVGSFSHDWFVGSATVGKGVKTSHHTGVFFSDHGEYVDFKSPPAAAKPAPAAPPVKGKKPEPKKP